MTFSVKINSKVGLAEGGIELKLNTSDRSKTDLLKAFGNRAEGSKSDSFPDQAKVGSLALANNAKDVADKSNDAAAAITDLRSQQLDFAKLAENTSDSRAQATYSTQIASLQTEINRVASSATVNGQNVFNGVGISINDPSSDYHKVVQVANLQSLTNDPGVTVTDQVSAKSADTTLTGLLSTTQSVKADSGAEAKSAQQKVDETAIKDPDPSKSAEQALKNIDDAAKLAQKVASEIVQKYQSGSSDEELIASTLDPKKAQSLLA